MRPEPRGPLVPVALDPSQTQPGKTDEAARIWNESVVPILKQQKGFVGAYMVGAPAARAC